MENFFGPEANQKLPIMCLGITSGIGRLIFGYIADLPRVDRILLQQVRYQLMIYQTYNFVVSKHLFLMTYIFLKEKRIVKILILNVKAI